MHSVRSKAAHHWSAKSGYIDGSTAARFLAVIWMWARVTAAAAAAQNFANTNGKLHILWKMSTHRIVDGLFYLTSGSLAAFGIGGAVFLLANFARNMGPRPRAGTPDSETVFSRPQTSGSADS